MTVTKLIEELKACPFCGGEAKMSKYKSLYMVECSTCGANIGRSINLNDDPDTLNTRDEVMEAWNLRDVESKPERTCRNLIIDINRRTPLEYRTDNFLCSACKASYDADSEYINHPIDWPYCPNCGAKVVDDEGSCE